MQNNIFSLSILALLLLSCNVPSSEAGIGKSPTDAIGTSEKVSKETYRQIQNGMSLDEVEAILGPGRETTRQYVDRVQVSVYHWQGPDSSKISLIMHDDIVTAKTHNGLLE